jgi:ABC-2 type transport system permease protein
VSADTSRGSRRAIGTLLGVAFTNLRRDRVAQALTFVLPIIFFSIFALVFGGQGTNQPSRVRVAVVDEDRSELSRRLVEGLGREPGLRVRTTVGEEGQQSAIDRQSAERLVRAGDVAVAVVIPSGLGAAFGQRGFGGGPSLTVLADPSDPVAPNMVGGLLQKVTMTAAPDLMMQGGIRQFEQFGGPLTPQQRAAVDTWLPALKAQSAPGAGGNGATMGIGVEVVDIMRPRQQQGSLIAFYAAGIGVMFLLFSMVGAAGSVLLDEVDSGTLDRLLCSNLGMSGILVGKWLFLGLVGVLQLTVMFLWGYAVFGLPLFSHLPGFFVMTAVTSAAAAALALMLATLARSRAQLSGFSTILILTMSALGGSMFPRFLMSETMQTIGLATFNAWALDGYLKVFWRDAPLLQLWPQVAVLTTLTVLLLALARVMARRWEVT